tara:strand:+ start:2989 stop:6036 length:3048 start_codon:yes stop_codon:yes gene_type:complete
MVLFQIGSFNAEGSITGKLHKGVDLIGLDNHHWISTYKWFEGIGVANKEQIGHDSRIWDEADEKGMGSGWNNLFAFRVANENLANDAKQHDIHFKVKPNSWFNQGANATHDPLGHTSAKAMIMKNSVCTRGQSANLEVKYGNNFLEGDLVGVSNYGPNIGANGITQKVFEYMAEKEQGLPEGSGLHAIDLFIEEEDLREDMDVYVADNIVREQKIALENAVAQAINPENGAQEDIARRIFDTLYRTPEGKERIHKLLGKRGKETKDQEKYMSLLAEGDIIEFIITVKPSIDDGILSVDPRELPERQIKIQIHLALPKATYISFLPESSSAEQPDDFPRGELPTIYANPPPNNMLTSSAFYRFPYTQNTRSMFLRRLGDDTSMPPLPIRDTIARDILTRDGLGGWGCKIPDADLQEGCAESRLLKFEMFDSYGDGSSTDWTGNEMPPELRNTITILVNGKSVDAVQGSDGATNGDAIMCHKPEDYPGSPADSQMVCAYFEFEAPHDSTITVKGNTELQAFPEDISWSIRDQITDRLVNISYDGAPLPPKTGSWAFIALAQKPDGINIDLVSRAEYIADLAQLEVVLYRNPDGDDGWNDEIGKYQVAGKEMKKIVSNPTPLQSGTGEQSLKVRHIDNISVEMVLNKPGSKLPVFTIRYKLPNDTDDHEIKITLNSKIKDRGNFCLRNVSTYQLKEQLKEQIKKTLTEDEGKAEEEAKLKEILNAEILEIKLDSTVCKFDITIKSVNWSTITGAVFIFEFKQGDEDIEPVDAKVINKVRQAWWFDKKAKAAYREWEAAKAAVADAEGKAKDASGNYAGALVDAEKAKKKAEDAEGKANEAKKKANEAETKAKRAKGEAEDAEDAETDAETKAKEAKGEAQTAAARYDDGDGTQEEVTRTAKAAADALKVLVDAEKAKKDAEGAVEGAEDVAKDALAELVKAQADLAKDIAEKNRVDFALGVAQQELEDAETAVANAEDARVAAVDTKKKAWNKKTTTKDAAKDAKALAGKDDTNAGSN